MVRDFEVMVRRKIASASASSSNQIELVINIALLALKKVSMRKCMKE